MNRIFRTKKLVFIPLISAYLIISFLCAGASIPPVESSKGWKAGVASMVITPDQPMWLAGYAARTHPSVGTMHDLRAKALVLEDEYGEQAVLITTDLLEFPKKLSDNIRDRLERQYNLSRAQIILSSSHTHSAPVLSGALYDIYPLDSEQLEKIDQYSASLADQIVQLVGKALKSIRPAQLFAQNGVVRFQVNRRNNDPATLNRETQLQGPNDYAVPVIKVLDESGDLMAIAFGYACHPTVLDGYEWSGDYPGFAQIELEKSYPGTVAMFFQGTGADMNPLPRRTVALAQQYGEELAAAVRRVLNEDMRELPSNLSTAYSEIELELNAPPTPEELSQMARESTGFQKQWAVRMLEKYEKNESFRTSYPYPVQVWKIGDQPLICLGGEVLVDYTISLKRIFGEEIFVMGFSNDGMAYIPSVRVLREGGYEGAVSQIVYGLPGTWKASIESDIIQEVMDLAEEVDIKMPESRLIASQDTRAPHPLIAKHYYSGFDQAHDTYNAISPASDGKIYYVLSSASIDVGGQMYAYDPDKDETRFIADLTTVCGEAGMNAISQGKSHVNFYEKDGKLYFATHVGYYEIIDGMERMPENPPDGYQLYPGGHILSYDLETGEFEDLAIAPDGEGLITMTMDAERGQIFLISWPRGYFLHYDMAEDKLYNLGQISANGEAGIPGEDYRVICRSMFVDSRDGLVYYSTSTGEIMAYDPDSRSIQEVENVNLRIDYFGKYDPTRPGSMGYNWRRIIWHPEGEAAYGVHGNSGYLFRFDPREPKIEIVDRITSEPSQKSGMFDLFSYGYLGFELGPDKQTLYYLTGGPIYIDGQRVAGKEHIEMGAARGLENLHLVTYNIPDQKYNDHGPIFYEDGERPTYVNSIAIGKYGNVYTLGRFEHEGKIIEDLVKIPDPF
jgi:hypothetical protein